MLLDQLEVVVAVDLLGRRVIHHYRLAHVTYLGPADSFGVAAMLLLRVGQSAEDLLDLCILSVDDLAEPFLLAGGEVLDGVELCGDVPEEFGLAKPLLIFR